MNEQEAYQWLLYNENLIKNSTKFTDTIQKEFFEVYNLLSPTKKSVTSCGRCVHNMRVYLQAQLKTTKNMTQYSVYRTAKGNLSFKPQGESVFTIRSNSRVGADEALAQLKAF